MRPIRNDIGTGCDDADAPVRENFVDILILGTSNSLLKGGYVDGLREAFPEAQIHNRSVGASPGIQFLRHINEDLSGYDCIVFDSAVNDENWIDQLGTRRYYHRLMSRLFASLAVQSRLLVLGFCNERYFDGPDSDIFELYRMAAFTGGGEFLSVKTFIKNNVFEGPVYQDDSHVDIRVSHVFGEALADHIRSAPLRTPKPGRRGFAHEFSVLQLTQPHYAHLGTVVTKHNSLFRFEARLLKEDACLVFRRPKFIVGFLIDSHHARCALSFQAGKIARRMSLKYWIQETLLVKFVPVLNGVTCDQIRITSIETGVVYERPKHEIEDSDESKVEVALHSIVIWDPPRLLRIFDAFPFTRARHRLAWRLVTSTLQKPLSSPKNFF
jgi:hypothetical protein